jgi:hypothetical protein
VSINIQSVGGRIVRSVDSRPIPPWTLSDRETRKLLKELLRMHDDDPIPALDEVKVPESLRSCGRTAIRYSGSPRQR